MHVSVPLSGHHALGALTSIWAQGILRSERSSTAPTTEGRSLLSRFEPRWNTASHLRQTTDTGTLPQLIECTSKGYNTVVSAPSKTPHVTGGAHILHSPSQTGMVHKLSVIVLASLVLTACGGSPRLSVDDESNVAQAKVDLATLCLDEIQGASTSLPQLDDAEREVQTLIGIFRANPKATYQPGGKGQKLTMQQVLADEATFMVKCDPTISDALDRALPAE
jgi:hypothetical protein